LGIDKIDEQSKIFLLKAKSNPSWTEEMLMMFCNYQKKRAENGEISKSTIPNYFKATKLFCDMNDIVLNWKKISKGIPSSKKAANDRAPTLEEIQKLIEYPDRRIKAIIYVMVSSGIRIGAWDYLKWKHVKPYFEKDELIAAKLQVYAGETEEYYSFITPEAYRALSDWMRFRESYGEKITDESWLIRDMWQTTNVTYGANFGLATVPRKLDSKGINKLLFRALWSQGIRTKLLEGQKRHEFKAAHGFRKYFKTHAEQSMKSINIEILMGHSIGVSDSYYKPKENEVLADYLKAVDYLTLNSNNIVLKKQVQKLEEENKNSEYIITGKLHEKDEQIKSLTDQFSSMKNLLESLVKGLSENKDQKQVNSITQSLFVSGIINEIES
jgi:integrase